MTRWSWRMPSVSQAMITLWLGEDADVRAVDDS